MKPTHNGGWFAAQLFDRLPTAVRSVDLEQVEALLRLRVEVVVGLEAPIDQDP